MTDDRRGQPLSGRLDAIPERGALPARAEHAAELREVSSDVRHHIQLSDGLVFLNALLIVALGFEEVLPDVAIRPVSGRAGKVLPGLPRDGVVRPWP